MAKSLEQRLEELDARRDALKRQMRERDKRERARADAELLRAVKDVFGDDVTAEHIRQRFGKREQPETRVIGKNVCLGLFVIRSPRPA